MSAQKNLRENVSVSKTYRIIIRPLEPIMLPSFQVVTWILIEIIEQLYDKHQCKQTQKKKGLQKKIVC